MHRFERPAPRQGKIPTLLVALAPLFAACSDAVPPADPGPPIPVPVPELAEFTGSGFSEGEVELLRQQANRNAGALRVALDDPDPVLRARAALALASVQDTASRGALHDRLADPDPRVRANAAFALGQTDLPDGGLRLLDALESERGSATGEVVVRTRILEALGKQGGAVALAHLVADTGADSPDEERAARQLALARMLVREIVDEAAQGDAGRLPTVPDDVGTAEARTALVGALVDGLRDPIPAVREASAWGFGRVARTETWRDRADALRGALSELDHDDPAAIHLVTALARLRDAADLPLYARRLEEATDWRIRNIAAVAIGAREFVASEEVRDALRRAIDGDPSMHVRVSAAQALAGLLPPIPDAELRARASGPAAEWRTQLPFVRVAAGADPVRPVLGWIDGLRRSEPVGVVHALELLRPQWDEEIDDLLFELAEHPDARVRRVAVGDLARRLEFAPGGIERHAALFLGALDAPELPIALAAVEVLGHPAFHPFGSVASLRAAWEARQASGPDILLGAILVALGETGDPSVSELLDEGIRDSRPLVRMGAAEGMERLTGSPPRGLNLPSAGDRVDPVRLAELGPEPRWLIETERGEIRVRMAPDLAPLTVLGIAELTASGAYDGVPFHRVIGGFVAQGGDVAAGDGTGQAGLFLPSEFTLLPFVRGTVGMASSGKDTEDAQFFLTHAIQPHLDGFYTAFGWVEEGGDVMDRLLPGDLLLSARIEVP